MFFIFVYLFCTLVFCSLLLSVSFLFSPSLWSSEGVSPYECGFEPIGVSHVPFCMKFFLLAIIFIVFDVEVAFFVPALYTSLTLFSFSIILFLGLVYEYSYGGLSWVL
jgi:NADH:ubiquinone oxidoreductase subunit 3 (subunit A)